MRRYSDHPYLIEVETNVFDIPQRVKAYDSRMFVVRNTKRNTWEIHSTENVGDTYCFTVPYAQLDCRTLDKIRENDIRNRGDNIFKEMAAQEEAREKADARERKNWQEDVIKETRWHFKKAYDEGGVL